MDWKEKIKKGMHLISDGCDAAGGFINCQMRQCPFSNYCWLILNGQEKGANISATWYWNEVK